VLQDICFYDAGMQAMSGCENIRALCSASSVVKQCQQNTPVPHIIQTMSTISQVLDACSQMNMNGCNLCLSQNDCQDPLLAMSQVCQSMWMPQCSDWKMMCDSLPNEQKNSMMAICGSTSSENATPLMRMYFHTGVLDYVLFESWVPRNKWQYFLTCIAILALGIFSTYLKVIKARTETTWRKGLIVSTLDTNLLTCPLLSNSKHPKQIKIGFRNLIRFCFSLVITTLDYFLMLIAMTFNAGLFASVILSFATGQLLFGHLLTEHDQTANACCG